MMGFLSFIINEGMIDAAQASDRHSPFPRGHRNTHLAHEGAQCVGSP
jgi:hypothetical protein